MSTNPPTSSNDVLIGTVSWGLNKDQRLTLATDDLVRHLIALGQTGSGKSTVLKAIAESLIAKSKPIVAVDVLGDLMGLAVPAPNPEAYTSRGLPPPAGLKASDWEMAEAVAGRLAGITHARYLTPCSSLGERLAINPLPSRPPDFEHLMEVERDDMEMQASTAAWSLMGRIGLKPPRDGIGGADEVVRGLLQQCIMFAWAENLDLDGVAGIHTFTELVKARVGNRLGKVLMPKFKAGMESLTVGQASRWVDGARLDWDKLLTAPEGKSPVVVIGIDHLPRESHPWVVSQIVNSLTSWCAGQPPAPGRLRVALLIDELKGEGGRMSLLPPLTYNSPSGLALRRVLRQGRHWGLGLLAGTQSPRDCDSRNFAQFNTRFVGKLTNTYDVRAALEGATMSDERSKKVSKWVKGMNAPQMLLVRLNGTFESVAVRWLGSLHSRIPREHIRELYTQKVLYRDPNAPTSASPGHGAAHHWLLNASEIRDRQGRAVVGVHADGMELTIAAHTGTSLLRARVDDDVALARLAAHLGAQAAPQGVRWAVYDHGAVTTAFDQAANTLGFPLPGADLPWYDLAAAAMPAAKADESEDDAESGDGAEVIPPIAEAYKTIVPTSDEPEQLEVALLEALIAAGRPPMRRGDLYVPTPPHGGMPQGSSAEDEATAPNDLFTPAPTGAIPTNLELGDDVERNEEGDEDFHAEDREKQGQLAFAAP